jgi:hypothetical protein
MRTHRPLLLACCLWPLALASPALADPPPTSTSPSSHTRGYAVIVGSNAAGAGQQPLRFAEDDAARVARVLRELGRFDAADVRILLHPASSDVLAAIDDVANRVRAATAQGEQAEVVFYYSGHARASAISLGSDDLALTTLRERLTGVPAALTIVVLDACQSGAFARVKGAEPAADFTYSSVAHLTQKGLAIMASSTAQELSQESDELRGSYFTHHLVTGLRGPADADGDGRVSLDEAYRYAYRNTLASTARTQVGEQHVTLETDLAGQGDVPVTYPAQARAQLELPAALDARVLVQHRPSGSVVAEVQKAPGTAIRLAFAAGTYDAIVGLGQTSNIVQCHFSLIDDQVTPLDTSGCPAVVPDRSQAKGESPEGTELRERDRWEIEGSIGAITRTSDAYTSRLQTFGYSEQNFLLPDARFTLGASRILIPHLAGIMQLSTLGSDTYQRQIASSTDMASISAYGASIGLRAYTDVFGRWVGVYGQASAGMTLGVLDYQTQQTGVPPDTTTTYAGYLLSGALGATFRFRRVPLGLFAQVGYDRAPAIQDLIGDTHDSGGFSAALGVRLRFGEGQ